jgi:asparagine synthase (glutamine-hydrolysing)
MSGDAFRESTDLEIVAAGYQRWGTNAFAKLIGDWALSIWNPEDRLLMLAKDFVGTRHLYYIVEKNEVTWCSILDPLVLLGSRPFKLEQEFIAGWLTFFPAPHLTPYVGIHSVPPSSFVRFSGRQQTTVKYWNFDFAKRIQYRSDSEYEEQFRSVLANAVRRRLRSDGSVVAELSGGMDSSALVCMADKLVADGAAETPRVSTVSYYDDSEPAWNERPYFSRIEEQRGRVGCHIDASSPELFPEEGGVFRATPGSGGHVSASARKFAHYLQEEGGRVLISGTGGDEVMGGVPTPIPELEDLLVNARLLEFGHRAKIWALHRRVPWFRLCAQAINGFLPVTWTNTAMCSRGIEWLREDFGERNRVALQGYPERLQIFGPLPSFQENISALNALQRQLGCEVLAQAPPYEKRYPYLDRCLMEFMFAIPREQVVRPGQRRSLMRRAMTGLVPAEILNRRRKAFVVRAYLDAILSNRNRLMSMQDQLVSSSFGIVDARGFGFAMERVTDDPNFPLVPLLRTLNIEFWLRSISEAGIVQRSNIYASGNDRALAAPPLREGSLQQQRSAG